MKAKTKARASKTTKAKRSSLGSDPFAPVDALLGGQETRSTTRKASGKGAAPKAPTGVRKTERASFYLEPDLLSELRDAALWFAGPPEFVANVSDMVARSLRAELDRLRRKHLDGKPIPKRTRDPQPGRPVKR